MIAAAALAASIQVCNWTERGANPYTRPPASAVESYTDIPPATRARLSSRISRLEYDDVARIRGSEIRGAHRYTGLRDMHFGRGTVCREVRTDHWAPDDPGEVGLVFCEGEHCLIVPTVCRNTSRVTRVLESSLRSGAPTVTVSWEPTDDGESFVPEPPVPEPGPGPGERRHPMSLTAWAPPESSLVTNEPPKAPTSPSEPVWLPPYLIPARPPAPAVLAGAGATPGPLATAVLPIPEPGTYWMLLAGLALLATVVGIRSPSRGHPSPDR